MSTIKAFNIFDILDYNNVNLDILTETFNVSFYGKYISKWPEYCISIKNHFGGFQGYRIYLFKKKYQINSIRKGWRR